MDWFKKHADTVVVISTIIGAMIWMNTKFNEIDKRFADMERELAVIKTVMIMKGIMPDSLANHMEK